MKNITFTGIDNDTDINELPRDVEYAILYNGKFTDEKIELAKSLTLNGYHIAIHFCSLLAIDMLIEGSIEELVQDANRIQLNKSPDSKRVKSVCDLYPDKTIITQHNAKTTHLLSVKRDNHALLIDSSSGKGILPKEWIVPDTTKQIGFAGGLNAKNITQEFNKIRAVAKDGFWLDIQQGVRDEENRFSPLKVKEIYEIFSNLI